MHRRRYLAALGTGVVSLVAAAGVAYSDDNGSKPEYLGQEPIVYEHDAVKIEGITDTVRIGDEIDVRVTNQGESPITLGCNNPWALQRYENGQWRHVAWTGDRYYNLCLTRLPPGETHREPIALTETGLGLQGDDDNTSLTEGRYRLILIGPSPYVAQRFHVEGRSTSEASRSNIEVTAPSVSSGETVRVKITARSVDRIRVRDIPAIDATIRYQEATFSPSPDVVWEAMPPTWEWNPADDVSIELPVEVSESVSPGEYSYSLLIHLADREEELVEPFSLTVRDR